MSSNDELEMSLNLLKTMHLSLAENLYYKEKVLINRHEIHMICELLKAVGADRELPEWKPMNDYLNQSLEDGTPVNSVKLLKFIKSTEKTNKRGKRNANDENSALVNESEKQTLQNLVNSLYKSDPDNKLLKELSENLKANKFENIGPLFQKYKIQNQVNFIFFGNSNTVNYQNDRSDKESDIPKTNDSNHTPDSYILSGKKKKNKDRPDEENDSPKTNDSDHTPDSYILSGKEKKNKSQGNKNKRNKPEKNNKMKNKRKEEKKEKKQSNGKLKDHVDEDSVNRTPDSVNRTSESINRTPESINRTPDSATV